ncbi:MAG: right-handed parallel beta-helix repeat-containing protein [Candidatus Heimdallarchaeaceae archaeon]
MKSTEKTYTALLLILLTTAIFNRTLNVMPLKPELIVVPYDYESIQEAINNANPGATIYVCSGNYSESITVNKTGLKIIGESKTNTIINLQNEKSITITAENTVLKGFTIKESSQYAINIMSNSNIFYDNIIEDNYGGIYCGFHATNIKVSNNLIIENEIHNSTTCGIYLKYAFDNLISNNNFSNNNWAITLYKNCQNNVINENMILNTRSLCINLSNSTHNIISNNYLDSAGTTGIYVDYHSNHNSIKGNFLKNIVGLWGVIYIINSYYNVISDNILFNNSGGIYLDHASNTIVKNNTLKGNQYGIGVNGDDLFHFLHQIDTSNKINEKAVYYFVSQQGIIIDSTGCTQPGFIGIINSTNVKIKDIQVAKNWQGILFAYTNNSKIENVTVSENFSGIDFVNSSNNTVTYSTISRNNKGIRLINSENELIHKNNFINNSQHVQFSNSKNNTWDNGAEGNFWDNYLGEDNNLDGIGDNPHTINEYNYDYFPLMQQVSLVKTFYAGTWNQISYYVTICSNSTVAGFNFNQEAKQISFNMTCPIEKNSFCNITIPKELLSGAYEVWIANYRVNFSLTSNSTHNFIYFSSSIFNGPCKNIKIIGTEVIPEFTSPLPLILFMLLIFWLTLIDGVKKRFQQTYIPT